MIDAQTALVAALKKYGPFTFTLEDFESLGTKDYVLSLTPQEDGTLEMGLEEHDES